MHWILQENLFKESEWQNLIGALERFGLAYSVHKVIPFIGELVPAATPAEGAKVICFGSYSMRHTAQAQHWQPGVYDLFAQNFTVQKQYWGERLLNFDAEVIAFKHAVITDDTFIRPIDDSKYFAGRVFSAAEFNDWQHKVCVLEDDYGTSLTGETLIQLCRPKNIFAEYRYWIVAGQIVTRSLYKRGDRVFYSDQVDSRFDAYVQETIALWQPHSAFVIDVCDTADGMRVVEINTLNAAGFYAGDVQKLVLALEEMEA